MMLHTEIIVIDDDCMDDIEVDVEYTYTPGCRGSRNSMGIQEEPDDPEELDIESVVDAKGKDWLSSLTDKQVQDLIDQCMSDMSDY